MKKVTVSAPGKVILMGEHAVVYGKPALISAMNARLTATVSESSKPEIVADEGVEYIKHILVTVCEHYNVKDVPAFKIEISSNIPIGYHLGSSAALGAALVGAFCYLLKGIWNPSLINQLAYEAEKFIHINASGVDPAAVVSGGLIWYRKELEFLRSIWQLPLKIPTTLDHFLLINTGRPKETTGEMVAYVSEKRKAKSEKYEKLFLENEVQTKRVAVAIKEGNEKELIDAIRLGERTLEGMGVVSKKAIPVIRAVERVGGAAKILGGGGRTEGVGFILCYHHDPEKIEKFGKPYGFSVLPIRLGEEGIRLETKL
ncbi:hypothetical protein HY409_01705 [Candidatus Gottesmanbacteria bacterium]|nr:hypothetical protein [Candidatus Gottesmanbacteria bacterium]